MKFQGKPWPEHELEALFALTKPGEKKILPLRYKLTQEELNMQYPLLSGILSRSWPDELDTILKDAKKLVEEKKLKQRDSSDVTKSFLGSSKSYPQISKYKGRACGKCGRRVKEYDVIIDDKCPRCKYDLNGDVLHYGI